MSQRLKYHFEPKKGWMNDPNGLIYYRGLYHAFFQHNPYAAKWGQMHWGHAVSRDLIHWDELPIALYPDMPYENSGGCFSGSAIEKDGLLYLFYTSVSNELSQTQSVAISKDGITFEKYSGNPVISSVPVDGSEDFRDPKVFWYKDHYCMICGSGKDDIGKILLYKSNDLLNWEYSGVLFESKKYGSIIECPDLFLLDGQYVLMFSKIGQKDHAVQFLLGKFDGEKFTETASCSPEAGPQFYAPQTFLDESARRIMIGWLYSWDKTPPEDANYAGALTIPRELFIKNDTLYNFPVKAAENLLSKSDSLVKTEGRNIFIDGKLITTFDENIDDLTLLKDEKTIEGFINGGKYSFSYWFE